MKNSLLLVILIFAACDSFNQPLSNFIEAATGTAQAVDVTFEHYPMTNGIMAIPVYEKTDIFVLIRNLQNYNLELGLEGEGAGKADIVLHPDNQSAVVTIDNPARLDMFNLTLSITGNGRPMSSYELPGMQARFMDANLQELSVILPDGIPLNPRFNPAITEYTANVGPGVTSLSLSAVLPAGVESSYLINGGSSSVLPLVLGTNPINIVVTADSGITKSYHLLVTVSNQYTVSFDINGGDAGTGPSSVAAGDGSLIIPPDEPARAGYAFDGWYREPDCITKWNFDTDTVTADIILYAGWAQTSLIVVLSLEEIMQGTPSYGPITISRSGSGGYLSIAEVKIEDEADLDPDSIWWEVSGAGSYAGQVIRENGAAFTLNAGDERYNTPGGHTLRLEVRINGMEYRANIHFTIIH